MCGITGLYSFEHHPDRRALHRTAGQMAAAMMHRGPDSGDVWQDPDVPFAFAHRRLSIIDLSPLGAQPMESASGRYVIVYNGEIYNFKDLRKALEGKNAPPHPNPLPAGGRDEKGWRGETEPYPKLGGGGTLFRGHSDTEVLLAAVERWGVRGALEKINGMFAFALWDRREKALFLARDRFGKKPLYVGWAGSTLVFGSELKTLCAHPDFRRDVSRAALTSYMRFGYVPAPLCIYEQVWQVLPGSFVALDMRLLRGGQDLRPMMEPYWTHKGALEHARANPVHETADTVAEFEEILSACVKDRMIADVPLGAFLSGGIDSSTVVALMQKHSRQPVKTYTIGFNEPGFNEAEHAKAVAAHLGTDHHELYLSAKEALDVVPKLPEMYDEPFGDISAIPTYLVSKFARESVTVALSGDGGDEMLGGYNRHIAGPKSWKILQNIPYFLRGPLSRAIAGLPAGAWDKMRPGHPGFGSHMHKFAGILTCETQPDLYLRLVSHWPAPKKLVRDGREESIPLVDQDAQVEGLSFAEDMMYWDARSYLNGDILTKVDRASMAVSLEARAPLLDRRVYEYVWRLPLDQKIRGSKGKWLLRQVLKNHVPEELFERPKQGFSIPVSSWLRGDLREWAEDLLDEHELRAQGYLDYRLVHAVWDDHLKGRGNHGQALWTVLMFQDWHRRWG